ncbi:helix-turn-helix domain-containing protein [Kiritimatiella glycovorans]|uniref:HTH cro/C1-type domain-containing protein n=1 Tax=Kiritimatiella glycovorans TaxID=1307763 RepID=A0A0G3EAQ4_9BACT|nr:helix-turn-helix transcriptional regulator [Kiritimatiella glycovorans]AKJ63333.1 hypothetical protein L21SP4_00044 [Kiritimatiella glycovorans]
MVNNSTLRDLRRDRGLTLKDLSEATGVALSTIGNYETGRRGLSEASRAKIARYLEIPEETLKNHAVREKNGEPYQAASLAGLRQETVKRMAEMALEMEDWEGVRLFSDELRRRQAGES